MTKAFDNTGRHILLPPPPAEADGHSFTWLGTGKDLLDAQLAAIDSARSSIRMETFMFRDSAVGRAFRDALANTARRGVQVRLVADALGSLWLPASFFGALTAAGGQFRWFNELRFSSATFRDHRKMLVVDDTLACLGGANIADEYAGDGIAHGWKDCGLAVRGPVAATLAAEFDLQWERAGGERLMTSPLPKPIRRRDRPDWNQTVMALFTRPGVGRNPVREALRHDLEGATDVAIVSAYFLPSHRLRRRLARAVKKGARVRILLAGKSDVRLMQLATQSLYRRLLQKGIGLWEYQPQVLHSKLIVVDDTVYVGSSNLDPRSLRINFEVMLRVRDAGLAGKVRQQFESDLAARATPVTRESLRSNRSLLQRLGQRAAYWLFVHLDPDLAAIKVPTWHARKDRLVRRLKN